MKIALLTPTFSYFSGIDRVVEEQAKDFSKRGHDVTIFCLSSDIESSKHYKVKVIGMPKSPVLGRVYRLILFLDIPVVIKMGKLLKEYDRIVSHFYPMNWFSVYAKIFYKKKFYYYDYGVVTPNLFGSSRDKVYMRLFDILNNFTLRWADEATSISKYLSRELERTVGLKSNVIYPKINRKKYHKNVKGADVIRKKYDLGKSPTLFYIGRLSPYKGIHLIIKAYNKAKQKIPNLKLLIAGKKTFGEYFKELENEADDGVIFAGYISEEEVQQYHAASDLYVSGSLWEGFNLPLAEAQACGNRVIAFDLCAHPEVVKDGTLVEQGNIDAFSRAIVKELTTKRKGKVFEK